MALKKDATPTERAAYNQYMARYMLERYHRRRDAALEEKGGVCVDCGSDHELELDHEDKTTKSYDLGKILSTGSEAKVQAELKKCVIRCRGCHRTKTTRERGHGGHGSWSQYYRHKCRCEDCMTAHRDRAAERKAKRESDTSGS